MPAEFQRLSDALRVIMTRRPVEVQLGVLDDFTGIVHRKKDETGGELLERVKIAARAFDDEFRKNGDYERGKKQN